MIKWKHYRFTRFQPDNGEKLQCTRNSYDTRKSNGDKQNTKVPGKNCNYFNFLLSFLFNYLMIVCLSSQFRFVYFLVNIKPTFSVCYLMI